MKKFLMVTLLLSSSLASANTKAIFAGSDTLAGMMTDAIIAAGMDQQIQYLGGGSGNAEKGMISGDQGLGPMSREVKAEVTQQLGVQGVNLVGHVIALDGIGVFVKADNTTASLDVKTVSRIFTCELTKWEQIAGSGMRGDIKVYRRNDASGTTDAFKHFTGVKNFGACVTALNETADIAEVTSRDSQAIAYAGLSGKTQENRTVALSASVGAPAVLPTTATVRDFSYPFARRLYVYEVTGARGASEVELQLLSYLTDRSFMDPIVQSHEFITID